jgi:hypothetical protein
MPMTVSDLIRQLGGGGAVADEVGVTPSAISHWIADGAVPVRRVGSVLRMARRLGVKWVPCGLEDLAVANDTPRSRKLMLRRRLADRGRSV